jgi:hypothetical protein
MLINLPQREMSAHVSCLQELLRSRYHLSRKEDAISILLTAKTDVNWFQPIGSPPGRTPVVDRSRLVRHSAFRSLNSQLTLGSISAREARRKEYCCQM